MVIDQYKLLLLNSTVVTTLATTIGYEIANAACIKPIIYFMFANILLSQCTSIKFEIKFQISDQDFKFHKF